MAETRPWIFVEESQKGLERTLKPTQLQAPALGRDSRILQAQSGLGHFHEHELRSCPVPDFGFWSDLGRARAPSPVLILHSFPSDPPQDQWQMLGWEKSLFRKSFPWF